MNFFTTPLFALLVFTIAACDSGEVNTPFPLQPSAPAELRAASGSAALFLSWKHSSDVDHPEFAGYRVAVRLSGDSVRQQLDLDKDSSVLVTGLTNGKLYTVDVFARTMAGTLSATYASIEWAPAERRAQDAANQPLRVYAVTATGYPAAVDLWTPDYGTELLHLNTPAFRERASLYVHTIGIGSALIIRSPELAFDPGPRTRFADWTNSAYAAEANSLNEQLASSPPDTAAYTATFITLPNGTYPKGRVYFGKLLRPGGDIYFRMLVKRGPNGRMVQGIGDNRYIEIEVSVQSVAGNHFAKRG
ncbi:MAG: fibronectin type III domain-containing protein [Bacteroidia bacterium]|nr:fibronectin type III domain-containing protein [Bacteroidia bacterium]